MRAFQLCLFLLSWLGFIFSFRAWNMRANLPYNDAERYFDDGIVYHQQSVSAYAIMSIILLALSLIIGAWMWRSAKGKRHE